MKLGFSIQALDTYDWPVDVRLPAIDENGEGVFVVHRFTGIFRHITHTTGAQLLERVSAHATEQAQLIQDSDPTTNSEMSALRIGGVMVQSQIDTYMELWQGWRDDLTGADGKPLAYSEETKRSLLGQRLIREAVIEAHRLSQGGEAVRAKNSVLSPEAGQATGES